MACFTVLRTRTSTRTYFLNSCWSYAEILHIYPRRNRKTKTHYGTVLMYPNGIASILCILIVSLFTRWYCIYFVHYKTRYAETPQVSWVIIVLKMILIGILTLHIKCNYMASSGPKFSKLSIVSDAAVTAGVYT